jgi:hypothetical protein
MNSTIERVNFACQCVRRANPDAISLKKLVAVTKKELRLRDIDIILKLKKEKSLETDHFYVMAYYDPEDDFTNETPIEVIVHHNFEGDSKFYRLQITDFLIQIFDAVVHELRHQMQSRQRYYETYSDHAQDPFSKYLADPDELDAYALSIAIELLRVMPASRAKKYMSRMSILSKMKRGDMLVSPNLQAYVSYFHNNNLLKKLAKKIYKHLEVIDRDLIFV